MNEQAHATLVRVSLRFSVSRFCVPRKADKGMSNAGNTETSSA